VCRVCVVEGDGLLRYSFPPPHPFNSGRVVRFWEELEKAGIDEVSIAPALADEEAILLFHDKELFEFVRKASKLGYGYLDEGDTPAFKGVLEAAEFAVGSTLSCVEMVLEGKVAHGFNPVGGLHHARPGRSAGFCVFNDIGVAIEMLRKRGLSRILYVDIDVHHGDGVFYPYETDPGVFIFDVHEDGRFIYPGTGNAEETGKGKAVGTKLNITLTPGEGDERMADIVTKFEEFATRARPEFVIFQCGADSLGGDPLGRLVFTSSFHSAVANALHRVAHSSCEGRMVSLGGGGYDPANCARAWTSVVREMVRTPDV
jgi:acetoin utilization protein AcuC